MPLVWFGKRRTLDTSSTPLIHHVSSAKDQLTGQAVAVKKIMKPFSTPVLSKRTYRELKLLKHLRHENVTSPRLPPETWTLTPCRSSRSATSSSLLSRTCKSQIHLATPVPDPRVSSYFVTELLGTDLHRLLTSRPLEKQFIQYFLYQILVRL